MLVAATRELSPTLLLPSALLIFFLLLCMSDKPIVKYLLRTTQQTDAVRGYLGCLSCSKAEVEMLGRCLGFLIVMQ